MNIEIEKDRRVGDIQQDFNKLFPYLKIEFYYYNNSTTFSDENLVPSSIKLGLAGQGTRNGSFEFEETITVKDFETKLKSDFGLFVRLFRKSGRVWLPAELTSAWSLKLQNEHGEATSFSTA